MAAGDGPPLLLIPGSLHSAGRWRDLRYFDTLAEDFRVLAVDPLGQGGSDKPHEPEHYTEPEVVDDLVAVLDRDEAGQVHVWGYGRGAHHAFLLARDHPGRVLSVTAGGVVVWGCSGTGFSKLLRKRAGNGSPRRSIS